MVATPKLQYCVQTHPSQSQCNYFVLYRHKGEDVAFFITTSGKHIKITQWFYTIDFFIEALEKCKLYSITTLSKSLDSKAKKVVIKWHYGFVKSKV